MTPDQFETLLDYGESPWLDWKKSYPNGLLGGRKDSNWDSARAELIKDISAVANGEDGRSHGYVVYGVKDLGGTRKVFGLPTVFDDADIQTWVKPYLDPPAKFVAWSLITDAGEKVLAIEIGRVPQYPHVVAQNLGEVIWRGQVWFRTGSQNDVALSAQLRAMFRGAEPTKLANTQGTVMDDLKSHYEALGYQIVFPLLADRDESLANGLEIAYRPGTRSEVWAGYWKGEYQHLVMLKPRS